MIRGSSLLCAALRAGALGEPAGCRTSTLLPSLAQLVLQPTQQALGGSSSRWGQGFASSSAAAGVTALSAAAASAPPATAPFSSSAAAPVPPTAAAAAVAAPTAAEAAPPSVYARLPDRVAGPYTVAPKAVFAVVELGGTQYKVTPDDVVVTEKLAGLDVNDRVRLGRVVLLGSRAETVVGRPYVLDAHVVAAVEEQFLDGKVLIFHKRRRKNSRRLRGHRQPLTTLRILEVHGIEEAPAAAGVTP
eukprot:scaffold6.g2548.t1